MAWREIRREHPANPGFVGRMQAVQCCSSSRVITVNSSEARGCSGSLISDATKSVELGAPWNSHLGVRMWPQRRIDMTF